MTAALCRADGCRREPIKDSVWCHHCFGVVVWAALSGKRR